jgi:hypothetical protein
MRPIVRLSFHTDEDIERKKRERMEFERKQFEEKIRWAKCDRANERRKREDEDDDDEDDFTCMGLGYR